MNNKVELERLIQMMFPAGMFPFVDEVTLVQLYRAYSIGFKDGFAKYNPDFTIADYTKEKTISERLHDLEQKRTQD